MIQVFENTIYKILRIIILSLILTNIECQNNLTRIFQRQFNRGWRLIHNKKLTSAPVSWSAEIISVSWLCWASRCASFDIWCNADRPTPPSAMANIRSDRQIGQCRIARRRATWELWKRQTYMHILSFTITRFRRINPSIFKRWWVDIYILISFRDQINFVEDLRYIKNY